jgi:hypothetical protein
VYIGTQLALPLKEMLPPKLPPKNRGFWKQTRCDKEKRADCDAIEIISGVDIERNLFAVTRYRR